VQFYPLCVQKKNEAMEQLESQLAIGIECTLDSVVGWFRHILAKVGSPAQVVPAQCLPRHLSWLRRLPACLLCIAAGSARCRMAASPM